MDLEDLIKERLKLQSVRRSLEKYGVPSLSLSSILDSSFSTLVLMWDEKKREEFYDVLAGPRNRRRAAELFEREVN